MKNLNISSQFKIWFRALIFAGVMSSAISPSEAGILFLDNFRPTNINPLTPDSKDPTVWVMWPLMCLLVLPVCLYDKADRGNARTMSTRDLRDQGYTTREINAIARDQRRMMARLRQLKVKLVISPKETRGSLSRDMHRLLGDVSTTYVEFIADERGI